MRPNVSSKEHPKMQASVRRGMSALRAAALPSYAVRPILVAPEGSALLQSRRPALPAAAPRSPSALTAAHQQRWMSAAKGKMVAPPMVYISGEEMTTYCMQLIMEKWIKPHIDTSKWEFYDCSCKNRDATGDKVLRDAVEAGARIGSIFKEPTITPSAEQTKSMGLSKQLPSPNGAMRRGWNGVTISRDTIHIEGLKLGYSLPPRWRIPCSAWCAGAARLRYCFRARARVAHVHPVGRAERPRTAILDWHGVCGERTHATCTLE